MLPPELIDDFILIVQEEWHRSLTKEEATALAEWLVEVYQALLGA